jgi:hypothetical protein
MIVKKNSESRRSFLVSGLKALVVGAGVATAIVAAKPESAEAGCRCRRRRKCC